MPTPIETAFPLKPTFPTTIVYDVDDVVPPVASPTYVQQLAYVWDVYTNSYGLWVAVDNEGLSWTWHRGLRKGSLAPETVTPYGVGEFYVHTTSGEIYQAINGSTWKQLTGALPATEIGGQIIGLYNSTISVSANSYSDISVTMTGADSGTVFHVSASFCAAPLVVGLNIEAAWVAFTDSVTVRLRNWNPSSAASGTQAIRVIATRCALF